MVALALGLQCMPVTPAQRVLVPVSTSLLKHILQNSSCAVIVERHGAAQHRRRPYHERYLVHFI
jgi:hypothetical protein